MYGNPKKQAESIIFNYDRPYPFEFAMGAVRSEYEYYTRSFNGDITLKELRKLVARMKTILRERELSE